jgi:16S rRNA C967 or C1407 C5-methylase (RsmB/RsmF family)
MPEIQKRLLEVYSRLVAPGGRLVFSVCTFRLDETERQVERFSGKFPEFRLGKQGFLGPGPTDGFYMAEWVRKE